MKHFLLFVAIGLIGSNSYADQALSCQAEVEKQEPQLASDSSAELQAKLEIQESLVNSELSNEEITELEELLEKPETAVFSFSNDAGVWISIIESSTCKVLVTKQVYSI